jgi:GH18 family chitinase/LysM repeat protein
MFTPLRSFGLGLLLCSPALALLRDWPNITSPIRSPRTANASVTTTECGRNAAPGNETCPLNVCCSEYGNCGTTIKFCGKGCQNNCDLPQLPTCATNNSSSVRTVGYYESWANTRKCQNVSPKDLNVTGFTHLNYAFLMFDPNTFAIAETAESDGPSATEFTDLKTTNPGLQTWIAIGGWNFNEPGPTTTAFSDMVSCKENRTKFINEITSFMQTYAFDGLDIDWEYPSASDRGGKPADKDNLVLFTQEIRAAFGTRYGLSITLPASYFYVKNFDLAGMQEHVDFFNIMTYDMHGIWDKDTVGAGPYILPHTNLTEIDGALDLLWRSKVVPEKVNLGLAWYGRSFTLAEKNCTTPNGVCEFSGAGVAGPCSDSKGTLDLREIQRIVSEGRLNPILDEKAGVKFLAYNETQWVSFDDEETIGLKRKFANERCLGGTMVWAMDQADQKSACGLPEAVRPSSAFNSSTLGANSTSPANCTLLPISDSNTTCTSILSSTSSNFTSAQLKTWNPQVASWEPLAAGQSICVSPPGGWYVLAQPPLMAPNGTASGTNASSTAGADGPPKTQAGISPACTSFATAVKGDTCIKFAETHGIKPEQLYDWNPVLGANGANCITSFWADTSYCVGAGSSNSSVSFGTGATASTTAVSTTASPTASAQPSTETETQAGISPACNSFATAIAGDTCINFAKSHGIEPAQLYEWNPILGPNGANCATLFWAKETYCIGVGTNSASDSPGVPQSPQSGYSSNESSVSSAVYTASALGGTLAVVTPIPPSSTGNSLSVSSEDICYSTVTSSVTQTVTETVYETTTSDSSPQ